MNLIGYAALPALLTAPEPAAGSATAAGEMGATPEQFAELFAYFRQAFAERAGRLRPGRRR
ncbi:hypothetical protein [Streptomyces sp. NPDC001594]|uniref:hypothetical protein n=1 Tax=Streptomyces sp. NPDC001594 TaxID=3364590 RepID=UPI0036886557